MASWQEAASDSRAAAYLLFDACRWRSAASRAYYATYAEVTRTLLAAGVIMPISRGNPSHAALPGLVGNNLTVLAIKTRWRLAAIVDRAYHFRIVADYAPLVTLVEGDARIALGLMRQAFDILKVIP